MGRHFSMVKLFSTIWRYRAHCALCITFQDQSGAQQNPELTLSNAGSTWTVVPIWLATKSESRFFISEIHVFVVFLSRSLLPTLMTVDDFNQEIKNYCSSTEDIKFINNKLISSLDPSLYSDGVHFSDAGTRFGLWIFMSKITHDFWLCGLIVELVCLFRFPCSHSFVGYIVCLSDLPVYFSDLNNHF
jgi:hypothetical protein